MKWNAFNLISESIDLTKKRMFPFDLKEWFKLLIIASLGNTLRSTGNYNFRGNGGNDIEGFSGLFSSIGNFIRENSRFLGRLLLIFTYIFTLMSYITSIFSFVYLEAVINKRSYFTIKKNHAKGVSLFLFRFIVGLITLSVFAGLASPYLYHLFKGNPVLESVGLGYTIFSIIIAIIFSLALWFWRLFLYDFIVPYMYVNEVSAFFALKKVWAEIFKNKLEIFIYFLARLILNLGVIFIAMLIFLISLLAFILIGGIIGLIGFLIYKMVSLAPLFIALAIIFGILWFLLWLFSAMIITLPLTIFIGYFGLANFEKLMKIKILAMKSPPPKKRLSRTKKIFIGTLIVFIILTSIVLPFGYIVWYEVNQTKNMENNQFLEDIEVEFQEYDDGGKPCDSSTQCTGKCIVFSDEKDNPRCEYSNAEIGCYSIIEDFNNDESSFNCFD